MVDIGFSKERFIKDSPAIRMGNTASELARLSKWIINPSNDNKVLNQIRKIAHMLELIDKEADPKIVDFQRELCMWRNAQFDTNTKRIFANRTKWMADELLQLSGLLKQ